MPFSGDISSGSYTIVGRTLAPGEAPPHGRQEIVGGDYFKAMRIPLVAGRTFTAGDTADAPVVCVIDEYLLKRYFAGRNPLGEQIQRAFPDARVVKALNTMIGDVMTAPKSVADGNHSVFVSGDDSEAKRVISELLAAFGWADVIDLGGIQTARATEMMVKIRLLVMTSLGTPIFNFSIAR